MNKYLEATLHFFGMQLAVFLILLPLIMWYSTALLVLYLVTFIAVTIYLIADEI